MTENLRKRIEELEEELRNTKVNKRTEMAVGLLKAKIARLKEELREKESKKRKGEGYAVKKEGDITIGLLGKPSVGKSTILTRLTNKESKIASYEFTTLDVIPGLLNYKFVDFQILDLPGIIKGASCDKGFGKRVLSVIRSCDVILFIVDIETAREDLNMLIDEIKKAGIRINKRRPDIKINKTHSGGIKIIANPSEISDEIIKKILMENKLLNCEVIINESDLEIDDLIDSVYSNLVYKRGDIVLNKKDKFDETQVKKIENEIKSWFKNFEIISISAEKDKNLEELKEFLFRISNFMFIYLKEPRKEVNFKEPLVIKKGATVRDVCEKIHKDFLKRFRFAKVKGESVKFDWQRVRMSHRLMDKDIVEINIK